jgi:hypothetical protein
MKNYIQGLFILIGIVTTVVSTIEEAYSQTSGLIGKFDGRNVQEARIRQVGELTVAVEINGQQWFASRRGETNFSQIRGCTVGDFNGDGKSDIACLYNYDNFDVGIWVLISDGRNLNSSVWWRSGKGNFNSIGRCSEKGNTPEGLPKCECPTRPSALQRAAAPHPSGRVCLSRACAEGSH